MQIYVLKRFVKRAYGWGIIPSGQDRVCERGGMRWRSFVEREYRLGRSFFGKGRERAFFVPKGAKITRRRGPEIEGTGWLKPGRWPGSGRWPRPGKGSAAGSQPGAVLELFLMPVVVIQMDSDQQCLLTRVLPLHGGPSDTADRHYAHGFHRQSAWLTAFFP